MQASNHSANELMPAHKVLKHIFPYLHLRGVGKKKKEHLELQEGADEKSPTPRTLSLPGTTSSHAASMQMDSFAKVERWPKAA